MAKFGYHRNTSCRICGGTNLAEYLDLGPQPPSNAFLRAGDIADEQSFPLVVYLCQDCGLSQLLDVVHGENVFDDYAYLSSTSRALVRHYGEMTRAIVERFPPRKGGVVADVGANDGITLDRYLAGEYRLIGVEPSSAGKFAEEKGHTIMRRFFNAETGRDLREAYGPAEIITATNVSAHVDDIRGFMSGFREALSPSGVMVLEFPYLIDMVEQCYFDTIYHEHLCYHALTPLAHLFAEVGLKPIRADRVAFGASGPAVRLYAARADSNLMADATIADMLAAEEGWGLKTTAPYAAFRDNVHSVMGRIRTILAEERDKGKRIGAYSAPAKGNTLLNSAGIGTDLIEAVAENNALKVGCVTPGSHIPIISDEEFLARGYDLALLLSWNYADFFVNQSDYAKGGGRFLVPLPSPYVAP